MDWAYQKQKDEFLKKTQNYSHSKNPAVTFSVIHSLVYHGGLTKDKKDKFLKEHSKNQNGIKPVTNKKTCPAVKFCAIHSHLHDGLGLPKTKR